MRIGDVNRLKVGEWVIAIGSPFGLESTVTAGIVSAKSRDTGDFLPLIQTDVAINPGNSGGPLINMRGEVVGINSQIYSRSGGYMGISFAIPIDEATRVEQLRASGRVIRGRIGVVIDQVTKDVAESIGLGKPMGALVRSVEAGGPAEKAGVEAGDIITKVEGRAVEKFGRSAAHRRRHEAGKQGVAAGLSARQLIATSASSSASSSRSGSSRARRRRREPAKPPAGVGALGLGVADLTDAQRRELKIKGGVRVESVDGAAARAGVREGDVLALARQHRGHQCQAVRVPGRQARQGAGGDAARAARRHGQFPDHQAGRRAIGRSFAGIVGVAPANKGFRRS